MGIGRWHKALIGLVIGAAAATAALKPADRGGDYDAFFAKLNASLRAADQGRPCALVDLDALDHNIAAVRRHVRPPVQLRVVVKSLPSLPLIRYILDKAQTRKLMVFHQPHLDALVAGLGPDLDMLLGKPFPVAAARQTRHHDRVQWLIDTPERLREFQHWAVSQHLRLKINLELDVGLHRGGARTAEELGKMLAIIQADPGHLTFSGFMGYDGHAPHAPAFLSSHEAVTKVALDATLTRYAEFVRLTQARYPVLLPPGMADRPALTMNSGGSLTYSLYDGRTTEVNDLSLGSAFVKPANFDAFSLTEHRPALYLASPILKRVETPSLPFLDRFWPLIAWWDPNRAVGFFMYGGTWGAQIVAPQGLQGGWFQGGGGVGSPSVLPNQALLMGSASVAAKAGDFVFLRPGEGEALLAFSALRTVRGGSLTGDVWSPLPNTN